MSKEGYFGIVEPQIHADRFKYKEITDNILRSFYERFVYDNKKISVNLPATLSLARRAGQRRLVAN